MVKSLPYGVYEQYCVDINLAYKRVDMGGMKYALTSGDFYRRNLDSDNETGRRKYTILKQPPNLYNPLDYKEEVLMPNNSANEQQPAKETETMSLPWQDISTLKGMTVDYERGFDIKIECLFYHKPSGNTSTHFLALGTDLDFYEKNYTHWFPIIPPETPTVEAPVEPEMVSFSGFLKNPVGKWATCYGKYLEFTERDYEEIGEFLVYLKNVKDGGYPIYATDPTAWLAHKAKQEGKN